MMNTAADRDDFPPLETERLLLRHWTLADADFVFRHFSDPQVTQYLKDEPPLTSPAQAREMIRFYLEPTGNTYNRWLITRKTDHQPIGTCGYHKWDKRYFRAEIGYDLESGSWGHGYMMEALCAVVRHGFERMGLNRIDALVYVDNQRSIRLLERLGFKQEGRLRDYFYLDGAFHDHYLFGLLQRDWKA